MTAAAGCSGGRRRWAAQEPGGSWTLRFGPFPAAHIARGHERRGARYAIVVQGDEFLGLSTTIVAPTSTSARLGTFRPTVTIDGEEAGCSLSRRPSWIPNDSGSPRADSTLASSRGSTRRWRSSSASETLARQTSSRRAESRVSPQTLGSWGGPIQRAPAAPRRLSPHVRDRHRFAGL